MSLMIDKHPSDPSPSLPSQRVRRIFDIAPAMRRMATLGVALSVLVMSPAYGGIWGSPKFSISQSDDRFSADGSTTFSSKGNRVSKRSIAGGTHIDKQGVFLDPSVTIDTKTGELLRLSLLFMNLSQRQSGVGALNSIGRPSRVSFLTGEGNPIVLPIEHARVDQGETNCDSAMCTTPILEDGVAVISVEQYRRLMSSTALVIKIEGADRSHVYEASDVAPSFISNLTMFYNAHVMRAD